MKRPHFCTISKHKSYIPKIKAQRKKFETPKTKKTLEDQDKRQHYEKQENKATQSCIHVKLILTWTHNGLEKAIFRQIIHTSILICQKPELTIF